MKRIICILIAAATLSGCATFGGTNDDAWHQREDLPASHEVAATAISASLVGWWGLVVYMIAGGGD